MKLVRYRSQKNAAARVGALVDDARILDLERAAGAAPSSPLGWFDLDGEWPARARELARAAEHGELDDAVVEVGSVAIADPVGRPGKIVCIGRNYREHAEEAGHEVPEKPLLFSKFPTSVVGPDARLLLPASSSEVDYEAELGVVVGRRARRVSREAALEHVFGYTNVNDVSARDFQFGDGQWQRGKSCDTFAPMGPYVLTADVVPDPQALRISLRLNGVTMQDSSTSLMIFPVDELIAYISETITLEPGDVIATGTPPGVGFARKPPVFIEDGDVVEVEVEGLGVLRTVAERER